VNSATRREEKATRTHASSAAVALALLLREHAGWAEEKKNDRSARRLQAIPIADVRAYNNRPWPLHV
jgi:hypothetical protein